MISQISSLLKIYGKVFGLFVAMLLGALLPVHPWDVVYNGVVRHLTGTRPLPTSGWRRRLTFALGFVWLSLTAWVFWSGRMYIGYALGGTMSALMLPLVAVHYCVVSEIVDRVIGSPGRGECEQAPQVT